MKPEASIRRISFVTPPRAGLVVVTLILLFGGCRRSLEPIFSDGQASLVWPAPPESPRIRYLGQLRSSADLKPAPRPFEGLTNLLVGPKKPDPLYGPRAVVCTPDGRRVWIADPGGRCLHLMDLQHRSYRKITRVGQSVLLAPVGVSLGPGGSIHVCDAETPAIHRLSDATGEPIESLRVSEEVVRPVASWWRAAEDALAVVDAGAHDVKILNRDGSLRRVLGRRGDAPGEFNFPCAIAGDGDSLWIVDAGNHRMQRLTPEGEPLLVFGQAGDALGDLALPKGVALDGEGHVYVVDGRFENVQIFDREGRLLLHFGEEGTQTGRFWLPGGVFIDSFDRVWVADSYNNRVQVFQYLEVEEHENS